MGGLNFRLLLSGLSRINIGLALIEACVQCLDFSRYALVEIVSMEIFFQERPHSQTMKTPTVLLTSLGLSRAWSDALCRKRPRLDGARHRRLEVWAKRAFDCLNPFLQRILPRYDRKHVRWKERVEVFLDVRLRIRFVIGRYELLAKVLAALDGEGERFGHFENRLVEEQGRVPIDEETE